MPRSWAARGSPARYTRCPKPGSLRRAASASSTNAAAAVGRRSDVDQHAHHVVDGATVQRPLDGAETGHHRGIQVGLGAYDHAAGERRGVGFVLGIQDEHGVEGAGRGVVRGLAGQHVAVVGGVAEVGARRDRLLALLQARLGRHDGGHLGRQGHGLALVVRGADVLRLRVHGAQPGDHGTQRRHGMGRGRQAAQYGDQGFGDGALAGKVGAERREFVGARQPVVPQQVGCLLERQRLRNVLNVIAAKTTTRGSIRR